MVQPSGGSNKTLRRNACYSLTSLSEGGLKATFTGDIEWSAEVGTHKFQLYYPYDETVTSPSQAYGELPAEQEYDPSGWEISKYDFMISGTASTKTSGVSPSVTLKHLFSILRLNITNSTGKPLTIERVKITSKSGLILAGRFRAKIGESNTANALHNATADSDGYFNTSSSSVSTTIKGESEAIEDGASMDVRLMINAGLKEGSSEEYYLDGEELLVEVYTTGNPVWSTTITGGKLARGARAMKRITLTPVGGGSTSVSKITPDHDPASNKFYLNSVATATGSNLGAIERITVGDVEVVTTGLDVTDTQIRFRIPDALNFKEAKACAVVGYDGSGKRIDLGEIMVYPFFYYKEVYLGLGSDAYKNYTTYASEKSFFVPDLGRVVSAAEWRNRPIDNFVVTADLNGATSNPAISAENTLDKTKITPEEYYASMPYYFFVASSTQVLSMAGPAKSKSVLRNHFIYNEVEGEYTPLLNGKLYGTPIIWYRTLADDNSWAIAVKEGSLTSIANYNGTRPTGGTTAFGTATTEGGSWSEGAVILTGYTTYAKGAKPGRLTDYARLGFIHIREITCANKESGTSLPDRTGHIMFDFYWSQPLNDTTDIPFYGDDSEPLAPSTPVTPPVTPPAEEEDREGNTYTISSVAELEELTPLQDGDEIIWANGTYADVKITLKSDQEIVNGITFRAESNGGVTFTGNSTLLVSTSKTTIRGFHWKDPIIDSEHLIRLDTITSYSVLTECKVSESKSDDDEGSDPYEGYYRSCKWVSLYGSHHTVEHCSFVNKRDRGALLVVWFEEEITPAHTIRYNYFSRPSIILDPADGKPANEQEAVRVGDSQNSLTDGEILLEGNHFYRCWGESAEVVSNKSCKNRYIGNYFEECRGTLTLRQGNNCIVEGNYFLGNGETESGGVRIIGKGHTVKGNHFETLTGIGYKAALSLVRGQENAALSGYAQVENALIEENIFSECTLAMHVNYGGSSNMVLPVISTTIRNNTLVSTNTSNYIVRYENSDPQAEITWEGNLLYGRFKTNYFELSSLKSAPTLEDVSPAREAIAAAAGCGK